MVSEIMEEAKLLEKCDTIEERAEIQSGDRPRLSGGISALSGNGTNSATGCIERDSVVNLTGRKITLYCQGNSGSDIRLDLQESGRAFVRRPKWLLRSGNKFLRFTENASAVIPVYSARPAEDLLGVSEIIEGIPSADRLRAVPECGKTKTA